MFALIIYIATLAIIIRVWATYMKQRNTEVNRPIMEFRTIMDILDDIIDTSLKFKLELDFTKRESGFIFNYETELSSIVSDILNYISVDIFKEAEYYTTREFIISYITKNCELFLLENIKISKE